MAFVVAIAGIMLPAISVLESATWDNVAEVSYSSIDLLTLDIELRLRFDSKDARPKVCARGHKIKGIYVVLVES
jgi:hypothetical protein